MRVTLVYPPNRNVPGSPFGALPLLAGCLGAEGHPTTIVDANLHVFDRLVERGTILALREEFEALWDELRGKHRLTLHEARLLQSLAHFGTAPWERLLEAEESARVLRDPVAFGDPVRVNDAYDSIQLALRLVYAPNSRYWPYRDDGNDLLFTELAADGDPPSRRIVRTEVIDRILATRPELVGVSIPFNEQTFEAFSLMAQLRERAPDLPVVVGGAIVTSYTEKLAGDPRLYGFADFAMPGDAEQSLPRLATTLEEGGDLSQVANLWRCEGGAVRPPARTEISDLNASPAPDFSTVEVGRYLLPRTIVNYQTSRGCYYQKCTFCSDAIKANFRFRRPDLVIDDIEQIQRQTGLRHFIFWDPLTSPRVMKAVARWNRERPEGERIFWGAETKFEKIFTDPRFTDLLSEGGAKFLQFGYESGSQPVLDRMRKGNDLERVHDMLGCLERSGIAVSVQWFICFPGATEEEDRESYRYLDRHRSSVVLSSYMGQFQTVPEDEIFQSNGDLHDIDIFPAGPDGYDYRYRDGSEHYDFAELHTAFLARGDAENITRMAFFVYLTDHPDRVREITAWHRGGALPEHWADLADATPSIPRANYLATWDFDAVTDPLEQGFDESGGSFARRRSRTFYVSRTNTVEGVDDVDHALLALVDGARSAEAIVAEVSARGHDAAELRGRLLQLVRRGLAVVPVRAPVEAGPAFT